MALTLKVPFSPEEEAKMAVAAAGLSSLAGNSSMLASAQGGGGGDDAAHSGAQPQANAAPVSIGGAKTKLDELFLSWLALPDTGDLFAELLGQVREGRPLDAPAHTSLVTSLLNHHKPASHGTGSPSSPSPSSLRTRNSPPPRSPSRPGSPSKHFTFESGVDSVRSPTQVHGVASLSQSPKRASAAAVSAAAVSAADSAASSPTPSTPPRPPSAGAKLTPRSGQPSSPAHPAAPPLTPAADAAAAASIDIPTFYFKGAGGRGRGKPMPGQKLHEKIDLIVEVFRAAHEGRPADLASPPPAVEPGFSGDDVEEFGEATVAKRDLDIALRVVQFPAIAKTLCGFPSFFAAPLFRRIKALYHLDDGDDAAGAGEDDAESTGAVDPDKGVIPFRVFLQYWQAEMEPYDHADRFFRLTKQLDAQSIVKSDLLPLMEELLAFHPGLGFLENTPEFQEKYARTVIARIFYKLDPLNRGVITARALRRSNLLPAFQHVDMEEDINLVNEYFSYEHFYVLYCKFWELDSDHDFLLSREDLDALGNHSLTKPILDRVFSGAGRPFECKEPNRMGFEDFVCFLMSEEDKTNPVSLGYWFRVVDLDGDGVIRPAEMRHFYVHQMQRMEDMNCEVVPFEDVLCQMSDLLQPDVEGEFRMKDFLHPTRVRLTGVFFSILSNLSKFTAFEQRDPFVVKQQQEPGFTAWDRFAQIEYARLAMEEDAQDDGGSMDHMEDVGGVAAWDEDDDALMGN